jgi:hypothetical protein
VLLNACLTARGTRRDPEVAGTRRRHSHRALSGFLESERQLLALAVIRDCLINCSRKGRVCALAVSVLAIARRRCAFAGRISRRETEIAIAAHGYSK